MLPARALHRGGDQPEVGGAVVGVDEDDGIGVLVAEVAERQRTEAEARLARWVEEGRIKAIVDIVDGLDKALREAPWRLCGTSTIKRQWASCWTFTANLKTRRYRGRSLYSGRK